MRRVPDVIDVWFDSGAMPFAQFHYPFENKQVFEERFPADFISEALDQTRGWFFSLLAIGTMLFDRSAYKNVVCTGLVVDKAGRRMSKSRRNTVDPMAIMAEFGADATRWYFYSAVAIGNEYRFDPTALRDVIRRFFLILWNTYAFFANYARLDGYDPAAPRIPVGERALLDRWLLAELAATVTEVERGLDAYDPTSASRRLEAFALDVSTWYVRRSRRRFWKSESDADKRSAYQTLDETLLALVRLLAPFAPFVSETIYRNLAGGRPGWPESVHMTDWPQLDPATADEALRREMARLRRLVETAHAARNEAGIKVRQPLPSVSIAEPPLPPDFEAILLDELNVKAARYTGEGGGVSLDTTISPELRAEGLARDLVRAIQGMRKRCGFAVEDRVRLFYQGDGMLASVLEGWRDYISRETLALAVAHEEAPASACIETFTIAGQQLRVGLVKTGAGAG
jgi:isoleucyl-tRNA synthetase